MKEASVAGVCQNWWFTRLSFFANARLPCDLPQTLYITWHSCERWIKRVSWLCFHTQRFEANPMLFNVVRIRRPSICAVVLPIFSSAQLLVRRYVDGTLRELKHNLTMPAALLGSSWIIKWALSVWEYLDPEADSTCLAFPGTTVAVACRASEGFSGTPLLFWIPRWILADLSVRI